MIVLTDGESNAGATLPLEAAEAAASLGIKIYTVGIGSEGPVPFPVNSIFGPSIEYFEVGFDEAVLRQIAGVSGGQYYLASDTKQLGRIYRAIDRAQPSPARVKEFFHFEELYRWFVALALALLVFELLLKTSRGVAP
jgi:Ca-activated chloride channel family protein